MMRRRSHVQKSPRTTTADAAPSADQCEQCALWEVRHQVAVRVGAYLAIHVRNLGLRKAVLEHITGSWTACVRNGGAARGFRAFFMAYCADVERDVDVSACKAGQHSAEYRRVWTNHALILRGELDEITPRFQLSKT
jgi:hypothetical protein